MGVTGTIYGINGPIIVVSGNLGFKMNEMVYVGEHRLVGEVIGLTKEETTIPGIRGDQRTAPRRTGGGSRQSDQCHAGTGNFIQYIRWD